MTDAEICLWHRLRGRQIAGYKFRRQHPFMNYVVDFACLEMRLIVELDGGQHLECAQDQARDKSLQEAGFRVLRFWNNQVLQDTDTVVEVIWTTLQEESGHTDASLLSHPPPNLPLEGGGVSSQPPLVTEE